MRDLPPKRPDKRTQKYHDQALYHGLIVYKREERFVRNPRDSDDSLLTADADWMNDLNAFIGEYEYYYAKHKAKKTPAG